MKPMLSVALFLAAVPAGGQVAHRGEPVLGASPVQISGHVWEIEGFPNIAIVAGSRAVLVVDTGLGPKNGAHVAKAAATLAPGRSRLYLTTTHFHPEHAAGDAGFPPGTILIRNAVQQQEAEAHGQEMIGMFSRMSPQNKALLEGAALRAPDVTFDHEATVDLGGGVTARLLWLGKAHTQGDELTLVEPDHTLISGDVVQNKVVPMIFGEGGTPTTWLAVVDKLAALNVAHVLPDHSPPGDGSLIAAERELLAAIRTQALTLKHQGVPVEEAGRQVSETLKKAHPDWPNTNAAGFVKAVYADPVDTP